MKLFKNLFVLVFLFSSMLANAAVYHGSGKVEDILIRKSLSAYAIIYVDNLTEAGSCLTNTGVNRVILSISDTVKQDAMYSMALAAYMAGNTIKVVVDDSKVDSRGYCIVQDIRLNSNF